MKTKTLKYHTPPPEPGMSDVEYLKWLRASARADMKTATGLELESLEYLAFYATNEITSIVKQGNTMQAPTENTNPLTALVAELEALMETARQEADKYGSRPRDYTYTLGIKEGLGRALDAAKLHEGAHTINEARAEAQDDEPLSARFDGYDEGPFGI